MARNPNIPNASTLGHGYITWSNKKEKAEALAEIGKDPGFLTVARYGDRRYFKDIDTDTNVRPGFTRRDYEYFRPDEQIPQLQKEAIARCMVAYETCGLIKNIIDLMADFACQGISLVHPNPSIEAFYKEWWKRVRGKERSERFLNLLFRTGNTVVRRTTAKMKREDFTQADYGDLPSPNTVNPPQETDQDGLADPTVKLKKGEIPWRYTFLSPLSLEIVAEDLAAFMGKFIYCLRMPVKVRNKIANPKDDVERQLVEQLPAEIREASYRGNNLIMLDQSSLSVFHYKKDDWMVWANPMIFAILNDIILYDKLKLTDIAACDSAISAVRLWRLGDLEHQIMPTKNMLNHLSNILTNNVGGGGFDLIWGPAIDFKETSSQIYKFLGDEKYGPTLNSIYAGLGIPPTLTGAATESGFTNNYISLKTLTERLSYGRGLLSEFWEQEIRLVQKSMGFRYPAKVRYDRMTLSDESAEKALLIQLADRDFISMETVLERFDEIPELEKRRMIREQKERGVNKLPEKRGPYKSESEDLTSSFVSQGVTAPSQVGLNLKPKKKGEKSPAEIRAEHQQQMSDRKAQQKATRKGKAGEGRPMNSKDGGKRKQKVVKPRSKAFMQVWAREALNQIHTILTPTVLQMHNKKNLRGLTTAEAADFEETKFAVLCGLPPFAEVGPETIFSHFPLADSSNLPLLSEHINAFVHSFDREPTMDEVRQIQALVYTEIKEPEDGESNN